jgi:hypothetical protein
MIRNSGVATKRGVMVPRSKHAVRLIRGLDRTKEGNNVTGGTAAIFHAGTAPRQRYQGLIRTYLRGDTNSFGSVRDLGCIATRLSVPVHPA